MNTLGHEIQKSANGRGILIVRILTWIALILFMPASLLIPRGITVFWSTYLLFYGPAIAIALAAIVGFVICRFTARRVSFAYLLLSLLILAGIWYDVEVREMLTGGDFFRIPGFDESSRKLLHDCMTAFIDDVDRDGKYRS